MFGEGIVRRPAVRKPSRPTVVRLKASKASRPTLHRFQAVTRPHLRQRRRALGRTLRARGKRHPRRVLQEAVQLGAASDRRGAQLHGPLTAGGRARLRQLADRREDGHRRRLRQEEHAAQLAGSAAATAAAAAGVFLHVDSVAEQGDARRVRGGEVVVGDGEARRNVGSGITGTADGGGRRVADQALEGRFRRQLALQQGEQLLCRPERQGLRTFRGHRWLLRRRRHRRGRIVPIGDIFHLQEQQL